MQAHAHLEQRIACVFQQATSSSSLQKYFKVNIAPHMYSLYIHQGLIQLWGHSVSLRMVPINNIYVHNLTPLLMTR